MVRYYTPPPLPPLSPPHESHHDNPREQIQLSQHKKDHNEPRTASLWEGYHTCCVGGAFSGVAVQFISRFANRHRQVGERRHRPSDRAALTTQVCQHT